MALIDINWKPNDRQLRQFAIAFLVFAGVAGGVLWWRIGLGWPSKALWIAGPIVAAIGLAFPRAIKPLYLGLTVVAFPIGFVLGYILLGLTYYLVVTPVGLAFRLLGRDPMRRKLDPEASTYWLERRRPEGPGRYFRQF